MAILRHVTEYRYQRRLKVIEDHQQKSDDPNSVAYEALIR
jgi:hypothetical protein